MIWFWWIYGGVCGAILLATALDAFFGMPTLADLTRPEWDRWPGGQHPRISIIVPARNEEKDISACLSSLIAQDYDNLEIIAVDDRSTDRTGAVMEELAATAEGQVRVLHIRELPQRWLGKTHAMWKAASVATGEWLLFTDGDIFFRADCIRRALAYAEQAEADHLVIFPSFILESVGERLFLTVFMMSFLALRPWKVPDPKSWAFMGAGAFNLVRRSAYEGIGTFEALRVAVVDDMTLGLRLKRAGLRSRVSLSPDLLKIHFGSGALGIAHNFTKNFYAGIGFRWWLAAVAVLCVLAIHLSPFLAVWVAPGWTKLGFAVCLVGIFCFYACFKRASDVGTAYFFLHPLAVILMVYAIIRSVVMTTKEGGVVWRDTKYPIDELRRGAQETKH